MQIHQLRLAAAVAGFCAAASCGVPPSPTRPSDPGLEIRGTTLLMVGARGKLTAWAPADGQVREVPATWTVEGDAVSVTTGGMVVARGLGHAVVRALYQGHTGVATVHVVGSVAGTWRGSIAIADCWQSVPTTPDPCKGRRGLTAPLVLTVTQSASADQYDNLRATVEVFTPPATGNFIGAVDSSGLFFLDGHVERGFDALSGGVRFRWQLEADRLLPSTLNALGNDKIDVQLSIRTGSLLTSFSEIWQLSTITR
jgi:hypothetical protein